MLATYLVHFSPFILGPWHGIGVRWYGTAYVMAFLLGYWMLCWFARKGYSELPENKVGDFIAATALFGVLLGGRLGYFLFYDVKTLFTNPLQFFMVWEGGMASHGGILGIILFTFWYARKHKVSWLGLGDNLVVAAPLGIFFGRCANFVNGELFGRIAPASVSWAMQFPNEILNDPVLASRAVETCGLPREEIVVAAQTSEPIRTALAGILNPRYPSQLIEAGLEGLLLFLVLWIIRTRKRVLEGVTTGAFFIFYAVFRIFGEQFREPDVGIARFNLLSWDVTRGQFLSFFMILFGTWMIRNACRRNHPAPQPALSLQATKTN